MASDDPIRSGAPRISRRAALGAIGALTAVAGAGLASQVARADESDTGAADVVPFHGQHQAGVVTASQERLEIAAFDVTTEDPRELRALMQEWTEAAALLTAGRPVGPTEGPPLAPPADTGEAQDLTASRLTLTFGFGPTLFERDGVDRFEIASRRPAALADLPAFAADELDPAISDGDLVVQACADDPQVAFHAVRNLARIGRGVAAIRWSQLGFSRTSSSGRSVPTPRNLQGFKDGTNNLDTGDAAAIDEHVWVDDGDAPWMLDGTYMVTRRIRMLIETWDRTSISEQENTIGRIKDSGAPLGGTDEFEPVPLGERGPDGELVIPADSHVRLAAPASIGGAAILRRGYSFTDGIDPVTGELDAGLFFICFQRDPRAQFVQVQRQLSQVDALNEYIKHVSSGVFAIPPGIEAGGSIGEGLLG
jgi:deferrochelatase/peroxidase EfeB